MPCQSAHPRRGLFDRSVSPRLTPELHRKRDGDEGKQQVAQVGDIVAQRLGVVERVDVGDSILGVRKHLVVDHADLIHGAGHTLHVPRMAILDRPFVNEMLDCRTVAGAVRSSTYLSCLDVVRHRLVEMPQQDLFIVHVEGLPVRRCSASPACLRTG